MLLIVCFTSITALSQSDTTKYCFEQHEVKQFLLTKVELNRCEEHNKTLSAKNDTLTVELSESKEIVAKKSKKLKRTRWIASGSVGLTILFGLLLLL